MWWYLPIIPAVRRMDPGNLIGGQFGLYNEILFQKKEKIEAKLIYFI
jgi:hypothetical protein